MTDKLGHSQIIPYILGLNETADKIIVISFEKNKDLKKIKKLFSNNNIKWINLKFTKKSFFLIKSIDFLKIIFVPIFVSIFSSMNIIHGRGHLPSISGLICKVLLNKKFIFDCRGLWADERLDNLDWNKKKIFYLIVYKFFKFIEKQFLQKSDHVVVLTNKIRDILVTKYLLSKNKFTVIPCSADYNKFKIIRNSQITKHKSIIGVNNSDLVIGYFGSISNIYMPEKMIDFFILSKKHYLNPKIIFFSDNFNYLKKNTKNFYKLKTNDYLLINSNPNDLIIYYNLCDLTLCFVNSTFARMASFPTKIAESLACGTPVLCNKNVGDIDIILSKYYKYATIDVNKNSDLSFFASRIKYFKKLNKYTIRRLSKPYLNLLTAQNKYRYVIETIL